ncbi:alpha/beta fold hydrolase [Flagellimonas sp. DF-77]|uniref:alpha/beta fold hydrolase n=1 Tax=Flagellimonas algarum TaxID=3230298 RepID=UPI003399E83E
MRTLILVFTIAMCYLPIHGQSMGSIETVPCFLEDCGFLENQSNVEFGRLTVPEDYDLPNGKQIKIAYAIIKAIEQPVSKDPIIVFQGGWGSPLLKYTQGYARNFPVKNRDVILFDYRGSGYSEPKLCDWLGESIWDELAKNSSDATFDRSQSALFGQCLDSLTLKNIDFNQYGSTTKTKDAVVLAEQLGYGSYNLMGISYGTRAITSFIRNAESSSIEVRSAILDSNHPMGNEVVQIGTNTENYVRVLDLVLKDCSDDADCKATFPDLKNRFASFLKGLDSDPWEIELGDGTIFVPNKEEINAMLFQMLYLRSYYRNIPLILEQMIRRNGTAFASIIQNIKPRVKDNFNGLGLINFVYDHKGHRDSIRQFVENTKGRYSPFENMDPYLDFFLDDQRITFDSLDNRPLVSKVPALFLAGEYDPTTPPKWTQLVAKGFENHSYVEFKREGHGVAPTACGTPLMRSFFDAPNQKPDTSCVTALGAHDIEFVTAFYQNPKISDFASGLLQFENIPLLLTVAFVLLIALICSVMGLKKWLVKKDNRTAFATLASIAIVVFFVMLFIGINQTATNNPFLLAFGLSDSAKTAFYLVPLITGFGILALIRFFKSEKSILNVLSFLSIALFFVLVFNYGLFPNF